MFDILENVEEEGDTTAAARQSPQPGARKPGACTYLSLSARHNLVPASGADHHHGLIIQWRVRHESNRSGALHHHRRLLDIHGGPLGLRDVHRSALGVRRGLLLLIHGRTTVGDEPHGRRPGPTLQFVSRPIRSDLVSALDCRHPCSLSWATEDNGVCSPNPVPPEAICPGSHYPGLPTGLYEFREK